MIEEIGAGETMHAQTAVWAAERGKKRDRMINGDTKDQGWVIETFVKILIFSCDAVFTLHFPNLPQKSQYK